MVRFVRISIIRDCLQVVNIPSGLRLKIQGHTQEIIFIFAKLKHWFSSFKKNCFHKKILQSARSSDTSDYIFFFQSTFYFCLINMAYAGYALTCYFDISSRDILKSNALKAFHL